MWTRATFAGLALAVLATTSPAQQSKLLQSLAEAEKLQKEHQSEEAARILREAIVELARATGDAARSAVQGVIDDLMRKADPNYELRRKGEIEAAKALVTLADAYRKKGWHRSALDLLRRAEPLDPDAVKKQIDELTKLVPGYEPAKLEGAKPKEATERPSANAPEKVEAEPKDVFAEYFAASLVAPSYIAWTLKPDAALSPKLAMESAALRSTKPLSGSYRASVEVVIRGAFGTAALLFGAKSDSDYFIVEVGHYEPGTDYSLQLMHWDGSRMDTLKQEWLTLPADALNTGLRVEITVKERELSARLADKTGFKKTIAAQAKTDTAGGLGFFVTGNSPNKDPVRFHKLWVEKL